MRAETPVGSKWLAWGRVYTVVRHEPEAGETAVVIQAEGQPRPETHPVLARLLVRYGERLAA